MSEIENAHINCPFCRRKQSVYSKKYPEGKFKIPEYEKEPSDMSLIDFMTLRGAGPGRGHRIKGHGGWEITGDLTLEQALNYPEYETLAIDTKLKVIQLVRSYIRSGVIKIGELT